MKKSTKGALAAGAAAVLLMGGASTLAYWSANGSVEGTSFTTGELALGPATCDGWKLDGGTALTASTRIVPGDTMTQNCTFKITATGNHLTGTAALSSSTPVITVTKDPGANPSVDSQTISAAASFKVDGATRSNVTTADNGKNLSTTVTVTFPLGDATSVNVNDTQKMKADLAALTVSIQQNHTP